jgi:SAM-dependent methyltransferase
VEEDRIRVEIEHAKRICDDAEAVWGWGSPAGKCRVARRVEAFLQSLGNEKKHLEILEIGSGAGIFSRHLMNHDIRLTAFDISFEFIQRSKDLTGDKVRYVQGDAETLPFKAGLVDAVFGISVLHHLNLEKTLMEMARLLRKGGKVFFTEPNMLNPQVFLIKNVGFIKRYYHEVPHETAFFRWNLRHKFEAAGFSNVSIKNFDFVHPALPERLVPLGDRLSRYFEKIPIVKEISGSLLVTAVRD